MTGTGRRMSRAGQTIRNWGSGVPNLIATLHVDDGHALFLTQEKMVVRVGGDGFEGRTKTILTANFLLLN